MPHLSIRVSPIWGVFKYVLYTILIQYLPCLGICLLLIVKFPRQYIHMKLYEYMWYQVFVFVYNVIDCLRSCGTGLFYLPLYLSIWLPMYLFIYLPLSVSFRFHPFVSIYFHVHAICTFSSALDSDIWTWKKTSASSKLFHFQLCSASEFLNYPKPVTFPNA